jgi:2-dehydropantoate 2-reductase
MHGTGTITETMGTKREPRIAVMGAGAVGCYFGGMLARADFPVTLIGRASHVEAIQREGLLLDTLHFRDRIRLESSTEAASARDARVVLFCVKGPDTEEASRALAPHLAPGAAVLSLQNGVDNVERIESATGIRAYPAVVYVAAAMVAPGHVRHTGRGDLILGARLRETPANSSGSRAADRKSEERSRLAELARLFEEAGVPCRVSENIAAELWTKMVINCAYNAVSALTRTQYGRLVSNPWTRELMIVVIREAVAVASAAGVKLSEAAMIDAGLALAASMPEAMSSTAQDLSRGKRTEIDAFNGTVSRLGEKLGVATPVNRTLHALVKLLEEEGADRR